mmetsp:Transcript_620/g.1728  ORF Transcript_620/g.1728 Transcript_620/m.1728 type:complete len:345 (-) Transcript_620:38-1072(-)
MAQWPRRLGRPLRGAAGGLPTPPRRQQLCGHAGRPRGVGPRQARAAGAAIAERPEGAALLPGGAGALGRRGSSVARVEVDVGDACGGIPRHVRVAHHLRLQGQHGQRRGRLSGGRGRGHRRVLCIRAGLGRLLLVHRQHAHRFGPRTGASGQDAPREPRHNRQPPPAVEGLVPLHAAGGLQGLRAQAVLLRGVVVGGPRERDDRIARGLGPGGLPRPPWSGRQGAHSVPRLRERPACGRGAEGWRPLPPGAHGPLLGELDHGVPLRRSVARPPAHGPGDPLAGRRALHTLRVVPPGAVCERGVRVCDRDRVPSAGDCGGPLRCHVCEAHPPVVRTAPARGRSCV